MTTREKFYRALWMTESSGNLNPPDGDKGRAIGPFQIHQEYWQDSGIGGTYQDVRKLDVAKSCVNGYMNRYAKSWWSDSMSMDSVEKCARIHNGGPSGYNKNATLQYWIRFKQFL